MSSCQSQGAGEVEHLSVQNALILLKKRGGGKPPLYTRFPWDFLTQMSRIHALPTPNILLDVADHIPNWLSRGGAEVPW
jgi:hypothetical protein